MDPQARPVGERVVSPSTPRSLPGTSEGKLIWTQGLADTMRVRIEMASQRIRAGPNAHACVLRREGRTEGGQRPGEAGGPAHQPTASHRAF